MIECIIGLERIENRVKAIVKNDEEISTAAKIQFHRFKEPFPSTRKKSPGQMKQTHVHADYISLKQCGKDAIID